MGTYHLLQTKHRCPNLFLCLPRSQEPSGALHLLPTWVLRLVLYVVPFFSFSLSLFYLVFFFGMTAHNGITNITKQNAHRANVIARLSYLTDVAPQVLDLVRWVFSDNGLPRLKVLAIGDFSNAGRWADHNMILWRDDSLQEQEGLNFRTLTDGDTQHWGMIADNMDLLAACPADPLFWWKHQRLLVQLSMKTWLYWRPMRAAWAKSPGTGLVDSVLGETTVTKLKSICLHLTCIYFTKHQIISNKLVTIILCF